MKKHAYFIGIDNGGSAIKAAVFNENGRELSVSQVQIPMVTFHKIRRKIPKQDAVSM